MTRARTADLVSAATSRNSAVPSFNVITLEHAEAIVAGAESAGTDVLLQLSQNAIRYHGRLEPIAAACASLADGAAVGVGVHLDHLDDPQLIELALREGPALGVSSLMIDASTLPHEDNVRTTRRWSARAHDAGLWVEAELGEIGGKDGAHAPGARTDPDEAAGFVAASGVDGLAVAIGSSHAMATRTAELDLELLGRLVASVPVPLVLHGSSGVPDETIRAAVVAGIRKVNVGTALNVADTRAIRAALDADRDGIDPRRYLAEGRAAMSETVARLCGVIVAAATSVRA